MLNQRLWIPFCHNLTTTNQLYFIIDRDPGTNKIVKVTINNKKDQTIFECWREDLRAENDLLFVIMIRQTLEIALERRKLRLGLLTAQDIHGRRLQEVYQRIAGGIHVEADKEFAQLRRLIFSISRR